MFETFKVDVLGNKKYSDIIIFYYFIIIKL